ncbi:MAG TPA: class I SAM-dependent methyltransferase [Planctomycetota bacterium]|nr:class I SAM-dependent methyltransferase [Planctomycetota bacterium]
MSGSLGLRKVARFNWPWYAAALAALAGGVLILRRAAPAPGVHALIVAGLCVVAFWFLASLGVSYLVYDRSGIARGAWLDAVDAASVRSALVLHAGQDEASEAAARALPHAALRVFDVHGAGRKGTPSLERARALAGRRDTAVAPDALPLADGTLDLALLVFAAHEIRAERERAACFRDLARTLAPGGRILVVEHLRDGWNLLAYGPGALHFLSRRTWAATFRDAGLQLLAERRCTPFVAVFTLGRAA